MTEEHRRNGDDAEALLLKRSFDEFNSATERMQEAFAGLEEKFKLINIELEQKNVELEQVLQEKETIRSYLENILENLTTGVVVTDSDGRINLMNDTAERFSGIQAVSGGVSAWRGASIVDLFPHIVRDGTLVPGEVLQGTRRRVNGRILEVSSSVMADPDGASRETIFVIRDVTGLARLEEMEKRSEKFAALEEMAATIAHEIRNPLGSIELFASLLIKEPNSERSSDRASEVIKSVRHVNNRISNLLLFTRRPQPLTQRIRLHELIEEVLSFARPVMENDRVRLSLKPGEGDPWIWGDQEMLKQVLLNLILNSLQAMPEGGELVLETRLVNLHGMKGGFGDVEILVSDTGEGIPPASMKRIFDPFFTTREGGVGLGLAIVHNIIDIHGGIVAADNSDEGGTVITITLPQAGNEKDIRGRHERA